MTGTIRSKLGSFAEVRRLLEKAARAKGDVLFLGAPGAGKNYWVRALHALTARRHRPLRTIVCSGLNETRLDGELSGHERGAFTGAVEHRRGVVEEQDGGVVLLDEIGHMPLQLQPKLLDLLEERRVRRTGSNKDIAIDVRFFFATNIDLEAAVERGDFRQDLYSRIMVLPIRIPRLEDCRDEIPALARAYATTLPRATLADSALAYLQARSWPNNVRELQNLLQNAAMHADGEVIDAALLEGCDWQCAPRPSEVGAARELDWGELVCGIEPEGSLSKWETFLLKGMEGAVRKCGSRNKAADVLAVPRATFHERLRRYLRRSK